LVFSVIIGLTASRRHVNDSFVLQRRRGFGDWGYHELSDAGGGFLRHEVLFATGVILLFEFKELDVSFSARRTATS
jgi:hypothetical protein